MRVQALLKTRNTSLDSRAPSASSSATKAFEAALE
jgi:hypothetical protein